MFHAPPSHHPTRAAADRQSRCDCLDARTCLGLCTGLLILCLGLPAGAMPPGPPAVEDMHVHGRIDRGCVSPDIDAPRPRDKAVAVRGTNKLVVLLADFPNRAGTKTVNDFSTLLFTGAGNTMKKYFEEVSYNQFSVTGDVYGWYRVPQNDSYYINGYGGELVYPQNSQGFVRQAILKADAAVDFSQYDNDGDGNVDVVYVVFAGHGASWDNEYKTEFWPHHWNLSSGMGPGAMLVDGVYVDEYIICHELEFGNTSTAIAGIGVFCHEYGHALGLPDLYDTVWGDYEDTYGWNWGLGVYDLMAYGSWGANWSTPSRPTHLSAWSKMELGWLTPTDVTQTLNNEQIQQIETNQDAYRLWTYGRPTTQYFLVENRRQTGFDADLPSCGLLIYHVDLSVKTTDFTNTGGTNWAYNNLQWDETHKFIDLECANQTGNDHTTNADILDSANDPNGSAQIFFNSGTHTTFDPNSKPSSKSYGGADSKVSVTSISACGATMTATLTVGQPPAPDVKLWIKDCPADTGIEPSSNLCPEWWTSDDIWIDNNDNGVEDRPVENANNHLYARVRNKGTTAATNVQVKFYYRNNSTGLEFPGTAPNVATLIGTRDIALLPAGSTRTVWLNWIIPPPPANGHYCIGVTASCAESNPTSMGPANTRNLGCVNLIVLYARTGGKADGRGCEGGVGPVVANFDMENPTSLTKLCRLITATTLPTGWLIEFEDMITHEIWMPPTPHIVPLAPHTLLPIQMRVQPMGVTHGQEARVTVTQYDNSYYPNPEGIMGGMTYPIRVDCYAPQLISDLVATTVMEQDTTIPDPVPGQWPAVRLDFSPVTLDLSGGAERIACYNVYRATTPDFVPSLANRVGRITGDANPTVARWQYFDRGVDVGPWYARRTEYYYLLGAVDEAGYESGYSNVAGTGHVVNNGVLSATLHEFGGCGQRLPYEATIPADITWLPVSAAPQVFTWEGNLRYNEGSGIANHLLSPTAGVWDVYEAAHYVSGTVLSHFGNAWFDVQTRHQLNGAQLITTLTITNVRTTAQSAVRLAWMVDGDLVPPTGDPHTPCCPAQPWVGHGFGRWFAADGGGLQANRNTCAGIVPPNMSLTHTARLDTTGLPPAWTVSNPSGFSGTTCDLTAAQYAERRWLATAVFDNTAGCVGFDQDLALVSAFDVAVWPAGVTHTFTYALTLRHPGDANANGLIDAEDLTALGTNNWMTGPDNSGVVLDGATFDFDCDGDIDVADAQALQLVCTGD